MILPKIRLVVSLVTGTDLITVLMCFISFQTVVKSENLKDIKLKISLPKTYHQSCASYLVLCPATWYINIHTDWSTFEQHD